MERFGSDALGLAEDLEQAGIDPSGFGEFASRSIPEAGIQLSRFEYQRAMPILIKWLPLVETVGLKEVIARGMTGEASAAGEGAVSFSTSSGRLVASNGASSGRLGTRLQPLQTRAWPTT